MSKPVKVSKRRRLPTSLFLTARLGLHVGVGREQEAASAAGGVADGDVAARRGIDHLDDGLDQRARGEILAGAGLHFLRIALQQFLVDRAFHVQPERLVDELNEALEAGRVLDGIARLLEDGAEQSVRAAEFGEGLAVEGGQRLALEGAQLVPTVVVWDDRGVAEIFGALLVHLKEQQAGDLFEVVAVGHTGIAQHMRVVPHLCAERAVAFGVHSAAF